MKIKPFTDLITPFLPSKNSSRIKKTWECQQFISTATRLAVATCEFFVLYKAYFMLYEKWMNRWGLYQRIAGASVSHLSIIALCAFDSQSACYALTALMGRVTILCLKNSSSSIDLIKTSACAILTLIGFIAAQKKKQVLSNKIETLSENLAPRMASFWRYS